MNNWRERDKCFGGGHMPSGVFVNDGYTVEQDVDSESRWRFTYTVNGKSVSHTFDMAKQWEKVHGDHPGRELW